MFPEMKDAVVKKESKRRAVIEEIILTETNYLSLLGELENLFMIPLSKGFPEGVGSTPPALSQAVSANPSPATVPVGRGQPIHSTNSTPHLMKQPSIGAQQNSVSRSTSMDPACVKPSAPSSPSVTPGAESLVTQGEFSVMFSIVHTIITIVREYCPLMVQAMESPGQPIGGIFLKMCPWLKHYAVYINSFDESAKAVSTAKKRNKAFAKFIKDAEKKSPANYDLSSYLILPVQRLGRYELLLETTLKHTTSSHPDYTDLVAALKQVVDINRKINSIKRAEENRQKIEVRNTSSISWSRAGLGCQ
tara:strand:- start:143 stop:1057 length:915 start_codon:yes stop_codon:yes gene_type:complete